MKVRGIELRGTEPKTLVLSDGSELALNPDSSIMGTIEWQRFFPEQGVDTREVTIAEALALAGDDYAKYVTVRTRAEIEWIRLVVEWIYDLGREMDDQAGVLEDKLMLALQLENWSD
jgi:hypothetical protein